MKFFHQLIGDERGLATAEYAVATVAACGFGGVLLKILGSATVTELLTDLLRKALGLVMQSNHEEQIATQTRLLPQTQTVSQFC